MITVAILTGALSRDLLFAAVFLIGCSRAFEVPTRARWCRLWFRRR